MTRVKELSVKTKKRHCASCLDDIARLFNEVDKTEEVVELEKARCAKLERKVAKGASYTWSFEDQLQGVDAQIQKGLRYCGDKFLHMMTSKCS